MGMAFCTSCGNQLANEERFCSKCGADQMAAAGVAPSNDCCSDTAWAGSAISSGGADSCSGDATRGGNAKPE